MKVTDWHIEPTNRCTLACPKCPRTMWIDRIQIADLKVDDLKNFFTGKTLEDTQKILFCGNHGDPIYHPEFDKVLQFFIDANPDIKLKIITNGSFRTKEWWDKILGILRPQDQISLSIDGLDDTNHLYRVNSKWDSVKIALEALSTADIITEWRYIVFKHNQHQIDEARELAKKHNFTSFAIIKSTRYAGEDDPLRPDDEWVSSRHFEKKEMTDNDLESYIDPICAHGSGHYISADGVYAPCCHMLTMPHAPTDIFYTSGIFHIGGNNLQDMHNSDIFKLFTDNWGDVATAHKHCNRVCSKPVNKPKGKEFRYANNDYIYERLKDI